MVLRRPLLEGKANSFIIIAMSVINEYCALCQYSLMVMLDPNMDSFQMSTFPGTDIGNFVYMPVQCIW